MGYVGAAAGGVSWGVRADGTVFRASGDAADRLSARVPCVADRTTRIDLAVTVWFREPQDDLATRKYAELHAEAGKPGKRPVAALVTDTRGGSTLYIGRRVSDVYIRVYNKEAESGDERYRNAWRYEVEYKGDAADLVALALAGASSRDNFIFAQVYGECCRRGIDAPFLPCGSYVRVTQPTSRTDAQHRLGWLYSQVRPTVQELVAQGFRQEVLGALDMSTEL